MTKYSIFLLFNIVLLSSCAQDTKATLIPSNIIIETPKIEINLAAFLKDVPELDEKVDSIFASLNDTVVVAQLIMPAAGRLGVSEEKIESLIKNNQIGGMILLNGTMDQFKSWTNLYEKMNIKYGNLPFLYSADAEPSLVNRKILNSAVVKKASTIKTVEEVNEVAVSITDDLLEVGINYNFAPVVDVSKNKTVGYRGFGTNPENIIPFSKAFISVTQEMNVVATAKHFPGHGLVTGDTHKSLQMIDGELKELKNYPPLIEDGVLSIMIAHIAIKNNEEFNTNGLPSTLSRTIVTDLLRDSLGFKGLIVTDAMGMGGVAKVPHASIKAIEAGCDIVLMPKDAALTHKEILTKYQSDEHFREIVDLAAKRIIRMKICLGML